SIKRGIFNSELFYKYQILTSVGIQKRYFEAVSRRIIQVENEYLLVNAGQLSKSVSINSINVDINSKIVDNNSTKEKKEKEIKVKESKVKETKEKNADSVCVDVVVEYFKANVGTISSAIIGDISFYLQQGFEQNLIIECIKKAVFAGKPSWNYVKGILKNLANSGVKTLVDFDKQSNKKKVNNTVGSGQTSYNLEELDEFWNTVPKLD
ncbi:MAG: DnaD domain protein, partial [Oscillospiraceae bacterium]